MSWPSVLHPLGPCCSRACCPFDAKVGAQQHGGSLADFACGACSLRAGLGCQLGHWVLELVLREVLLVLSELDDLNELNAV